jgi:hypothetical protein
MKTEATHPASKKMAISFRFSPGLLDENKRCAAGGGVSEALSLFPTAIPRKRSGCAPKRNDFLMDRSVRRFRGKPGS